MVDGAMVMRKLAALETYHAQAAEYAAVTVAQYKSDWKVQRVIERTLQMAIEACADIADHIISDGSMRIPSGYADAFRVLGENGVIGPGLAERMIKMIGFRNLVVHQYEDVDAAIVVEILQSRLGDFIDYKDAVVKHIGS